MNNFSWDLAAVGNEASHITFGPKLDQLNSYIITIYCPVTIFFVEMEHVFI